MPKYCLNWVLKIAANISCQNKRFKCEYMATLMLRTPTESARNEDFQSSFFFLEEIFIVGTGEAIRTE